MLPSSSTSPLSNRTSGHSFVHPSTFSETFKDIGSGYLGVRWGWSYLGGDELELTEGIPDPQDISAREGISSSDFSFPEITR